MIELLEDLRYWRGIKTKNLAQTLLNKKRFQEINLETLSAFAHLIGESCKFDAMTIYLTIRKTIS